MSESSKRPLQAWAEENHRGEYGLRWRIRRSLFHGESEFQQIDIVETTAFGRMLFNDGVAMLSERDEFVYHEMIAHVPMFLHDGARRVLVIGGGDGGTVRELLRHDSVERCVLVEIDPVVVEGCREYLPQTAAALQDPRCEVRIGDGVAYVAEAAAGGQRFDVVLVDSTDPIGPATPLFNDAFYADVRRVLNPGGLVVSQAESPFLEAEWQGSLAGTLADAFQRVWLYNYVTMTYPGGLWSFALATDADVAPLSGLDDRRVTRSGIEFRYYTPEVHRAAFALPAFQRRRLADRLAPPR